MCRPRLDTPAITPPIASSQMPPTEIRRESGLFLAWNQPLAKALLTGDTLVDSARSAAQATIAPLVMELR